MLNLTPHSISVFNRVTGQVDTFPPSGTLARVSTVSKDINHLLPYAVGVTTYGEVENVPPVYGEVFLVSAMVLDRLDPAYHGQAFAPDTGPSAVRDSNGFIKHVVALKTVAE